MRLSTIDIAAHPALRRLGLICAVLGIVSPSIGCFRAAANRDLASAIAIKGKDVSSGALGVYSDLAKQPEIDKAQQDFVKVVTSPNPTAAILPDLKLRSFEAQLGPRMVAYKALLRAYSTYQTLTSKDFGKQANTAASSLSGAFSALKAVPDLPGVMAPALSLVNGLILEAEQAKSIRKYNIALMELTKAYQTLWDQDLPVWKQYLNRIYQDYADGLLSLDAERFDEKGLAATVKEPFSKSINVNLYKIQRRNAAQEERNEMTGKLDQVSAAFSQLESAQAELAKPQPNLADAFAALDRITSTLPGTAKQ